MIDLGAIMTVGVLFQIKNLLWAAWLEPIIIHFKKESMKAAVRLKISRKSRSKTIL